MNPALASPALSALCAGAAAYAAAETKRTQFWQSLKFAFDGSALLKLLGLLVVPVALTAALAVGNPEHHYTWLIFLVAAVLPFLLRTAALPTSLIGVVLFVLSVVLTEYLPGTWVSDYNLAALGGFLVYKVIDQLFIANEAKFDDILPATVWLSASSWYHCTAFDFSMTKTVLTVSQQENVVAVSFAVAFLLKAIPQSFLKGDIFFAKRLLLSVIGGLAAWLFTSHVLLLPKLAITAAFIGASIFANLLLEATPNEGAEVSQFDFSIQFLVLVGLLSLLASRFLGTFGLFVIAPPALLCAGSGAAVCAGFYWSMRGLLQAFEEDFNFNVTGINLLHPYVGASLYAGILAVFIAAAVFCGRSSSWRNAAGFLALAIFLPLMSSYFMHVEPTGGFLISVLSAGIMLGCLAPAIARATEKQQNFSPLILLPAISITAARLGGGLIAAGNQSATSARIYAAATIAGVLILALLVSYAISVLRQQRQNVSITGDQ